MSSLKEKLCALKKRGAPFILYRRRYVRLVHYYYLSNKLSSVIGMGNRKYFSKKCVLNFFAAKKRHEITPGCQYDCVTNHGASDNKRKSTKERQYDMRAKTKITPHQTQPSTAWHGMHTHILIYKLPTMTNHANKIALFFIVVVGGVCVSLYLSTLSYSSRLLLVSTMLGHTQHDFFNLRNRARLYFIALQIYFMVFRVRKKNS